MRPRALAAAAILLLTALALVAPPASGATFPRCSTDIRLQLYVTFNDASSESGAFTVAGCTYPFGYAVEIWFRVGSNPGLGDPIAGLPTTSVPLVLQSRWTDGHFHKTLTLPADSPDRILVNADLITPYRAPTGYYYDGSFPVRVPQFVPSGTDESYTVTNPGRKTADASVAWAPAGSPPGTCTLFGGVDASGAHVHVWFEDALNGSSIPGLYSRDAPWIGHLANRRFVLSYVLPANLTIDFTQPNIKVKMQVLETGTIIGVTIWVHRMV